MTSIVVPMGWAITRAGMCGVLNNALSIYLGDTVLGGHPEHARQRHPRIGPMPHQRL